MHRKHLYTIILGTPIATILQILKSVTTRIYIIHVSITRFEPKWFSSKLCRLIENILQLLNIGCDFQSQTNVGPTKRCMTKKTLVVALFITIRIVTTSVPFFKCKRQGQKLITDWIFFLTVVIYQSTYT
jgi:hypothetical protein